MLLFPWCSSPTNTWEGESYGTDVLSPMPLPFVFPRYCQSCYNVHLYQQFTASFGHVLFNHLSCINKACIFILSQKNNPPTHSSAIKKNQYREKCKEYKWVLIVAPCLILHTHLLAITALGALLESGCISFQQSLISQECLEIFVSDLRYGSGCPSNYHRELIFQML